MGKNIVVDMYMVLSILHGKVFSLSISPALSNFMSFNNWTVPW